MSKRKFKIYFSDFYDVHPDALKNYGAFNISLLNDLPLFVDPFLLFNSENETYLKLHEEIIKYVQFLKTQSSRNLPIGALKSWFYFSEIKENWLGYSKSGNSGRGLGAQFANSLKLNLTTIFKDFGDENKSSTHLEKLTLVKNGIGKDQLSDFTCNLICGFLAEFTENFAKTHIDKKYLGTFHVPKVKFNYTTQTWASKQYTLPKLGKEFVLLCPIDILTKDEAWINHRGFVEDYSQIIASVDNDQLRSDINNYFHSKLPIEATNKELEVTLEELINKYPVLLDHYIAIKEKDGNAANAQSIKKLQEANEMFVEKLKELILILDKTKFYDTPTNSFEEGLARVHFLKHVIESQDGYRIFYSNNKPISKEADLQIMFKLTWFASTYDSNAEVNNGRGPCDFMVSYGSKDKTAIEFKLAKNSRLEANLLNQAEIYSDAARATHPPIKVILYFKQAELTRVQDLLIKHKLNNKREIVLIDATSDKLSASKA
jgi:hypothetical protein